jgi:hypothetical protein
MQDKKIYKKIRAYPSGATGSKIEHFALNKSSLLLKVQKENTQTFQLFKKIIKIESIYKSN